MNEQIPTGDDVSEAVNVRPVGGEKTVGSDIHTEGNEGRDIAIIQRLANDEKLLASLPEYLQKKLFDGALFSEEENKELAEFIEKYLDTEENNSEESGHEAQGGGVVAENNKSGGETHGGGGEGDKKKRRRGKRGKGGVQRQGEEEANVFAGLREDETNERESNGAPGTEADDVFGETDTESADERKVEMPVSGGYSGSHDLEWNDPARGVRVEQSPKKPSQEQSVQTAHAAQDILDTMNLDELTEKGEQNEDVMEDRKNDPHDSWHEHDRGRIGTNAGEELDPDQGLVGEGTARTGAESDSAEQQPTPEDAEAQPESLDERIAAQERECAAARREYVQQYAQFDAKYEKASAKARRGVQKLFGMVRGKGTTTKQEDFEGNEEAYGAYKRYTSERLALEKLAEEKARQRLKERNGGTDEEILKQLLIREKRAELKSESPDAKIKNVGDIARLGITEDDVVKKLTEEGVLNEEGGLALKDGALKLALSSRKDAVEAYRKRQGSGRALEALKRQGTIPEEDHNLDNEQLSQKYNTEVDRYAEQQENKLMARYVFQDRVREMRAVRHEQIAAMPEKEKGWVRRRLEWYERQNKAVRWSIGGAVAVAGGTAFAFGGAMLFGAGAGTAAAVGAGAGLRRVPAYFLSSTVGVTLAKFGVQNLEKKVWSKIRERSRGKENVDIRKEATASIDVNQDKSFARLQQMFENDERLQRRHKLYGRGVVMGVAGAVGMGTGAGLQLSETADGFVQDTTKSVVDSFRGRGDGVGSPDGTETVPDTPETDTQEKGTHGGRENMGLSEFGTKPEVAPAPEEPASAPRRNAPPSDWGRPQETPEPRQPGVRVEPTGGAHSVGEPPAHNGSEGAPTVDGNGADDTLESPPDRGSESVQQQGVGNREQEGSPTEDTNTPKEDIYAGPSNAGLTPENVEYVDETAGSGNEGVTDEIVRRADDANYRGGGNEGLTPDNIQHIEDVSTPNKQLVLEGTYKQGGSIWRIIENHVDAEHPDLSEAERTYVIDKLKDDVVARVHAGDEEFMEAAGIHGNDAGNVHAGESYKLAFDRAEIDQAVQEANGLTEAQKASIIENQESQQSGASAESGQGSVYERDAVKGAEEIEHLIEEGGLGDKNFDVAAWRQLDALKEDNNFMARIGGESGPNWHRIRAYWGVIKDIPVEEITDAKPGISYTIGGEQHTLSPDAEYVVQKVFLAFKGAYPGHPALIPDPAHPNGTMGDALRQILSTESGGVGATELEGGSTPDAIETSTDVPAPKEAQGTEPVLKESTPPAESSGGFNPNPLKPSEIVRALGLEDKPRVSLMVSHLREDSVGSVFENDIGRYSSKLWSSRIDQLLKALEQKGIEPPSAAEKDIPFLEYVNSKLGTNTPAPPTIEADATPQGVGAPSAEGTDPRSLIGKEPSATSSDVGGSSKTNKSYELLQEPPKEGVLDKRTGDRLYKEADVAVRGDGEIKIGPFAIESDAGIGIEHKDAPKTKIDVGGYDERYERYGAGRAVAYLDNELSDAQIKSLATITADEASAQDIIDMNEKGRAALATRGLDGENGAYIQEGLKDLQERAYDTSSYPRPRRSGSMFGNIEMKGVPDASKLPPFEYAAQKEASHHYASHYQKGGRSGTSKRWPR